MNRRGLADGFGGKLQEALDEPKEMLNLSFFHITCEKCNKIALRKGSSRFKNEFGRIKYICEECKR